MDQTIKGIIGEDKNPYETRTYTISARPEHLDKIEQLFSWINSTRSGHSGQAGIFVDGDGAARVTIEKKDGEIPKFSDKDTKQRSYNVEFTVGLD